MIETQMPDDWTPQLAHAIAAALREFAMTLRGTPVVLLAVDCQPWHGTVGLAALTDVEAAADELLDNPAEMAAWQYFNFTTGLRSWEPAESLGRGMQTAYQAATDRRAMADSFLRACAEALASPEVAASVELLERAKSFRVSVPHPDDSREFWPPGAKPESRVSADLL